MPERLNGAVSKTVVHDSCTVGSNPTSSAISIYHCGECINMIKRVVFLKFKKSYTSSQIDKLLLSLDTFISTLPYVHNYTYGPYYDDGEGNNYPEFTHCIAMEFASDKDFATYITNKSLQHISETEVVPALDQGALGAVVFNYIPQTLKEANHLQEGGTRDGLFQDGLR